MLCSKCAAGMVLHARTSNSLNSPTPPLHDPVAHQNDVSRGPGCFNAPDAGLPLNCIYSSASRKGAGVLKSHFASSLDPHAAYNYFPSNLLAASEANLLLTIGRTLSSIPNLGVQRCYLPSGFHVLPTF